MDILINNKKHSWQSNFLTEVNKVNQTKWSKKREDYFSKEVIGGTKCFIKRAENGFEGAAIFQKLVGKHVEGIPKTYGFGECIENNRTVQYLITEFIEGDTLDEVLNSGKKVNNTLFTSNLLNSVNYLYSLGFWHSDINGDNIFISKKGQAFLIDIDSCVDNKISPTHIPSKEGGLTTLSNQIGSYALKYYNRYLSKPTSFGYGSIPGVNLNYMQIIFLTYQLKYFQGQKVMNPSLFWKKSTFKGLNIEDEVRKVNPQYSDSLFKAALLKPLHKEVVNNLTKEIISTSIKTAPDTIKLRKMKELKDLKVKYAQLEQLVSTHTTERSKMMTEIDTLKKNKSNKSSSGWTWFWGVAASLAAAIGFFLYNGVSQDRDYYQNNYWDQQVEVKKLKELNEDLEEEYSELDNMIVEIASNIPPVHVKSVNFENSYNSTEGSSFYNSSLTRIAPKINLYSLVNKSVQVSFKKESPSGYLTTYAETVKNVKDKYYIYKDVNLKKGVNEVEFSSFGQSSTNSWTLGKYKYSFYLDNDLIETKYLIVK